jgi:hypothetical protein
MEDNYQKQIQSNTTIILNLEYLGVHFEDTKEERGSCGLFSKTAYYYSVPEASTLEVNNKLLNERIKTANGLKYLAKETLIDMIIDSCKNESEDDEFVDDVKNNIHDYFKFYAKVRVGEIWTEDLAKQRIKDIEKEIQEARKYREI